MVAKYVDHGCGSNSMAAEARWEAGVAQITVNGFYSAMA
ncbi:hypothetical protein A2U01_0063846 [Trifolium medium]|uniref:Uncharacterized protein n=1 Tax=Trifolium medium TaxID=97028 RepID=A0A392S1S1_9FABA|nr:hypothetical protein [Trifolium medium]